jgi:glycosyltransferase involved in cell wall biosynthesis
MFSIVIPVYKNELNIPDLGRQLNRIALEIDAPTEIVFVVDGSPDNSYTLIKNMLPSRHFSSQLIQLSRNFGSFSAIRAGLEHATGKYFAVMAADLQEPPELIKLFYQELISNQFDVVAATRTGRNDPGLSKLFSSTYWFFYRIFINKSIPRGGVDIFGCNTVFRSALIKLDESHSSLIGLLFWLGFRRKIIGYERKERALGKSAWSFSKKFKYFNDSIFAFSDLPIKILMALGILGVLLSSVISLLVLILKLSGNITVPGYAATALMISFFSALNMLGLGIIGNYIWRIYENTKARPLSVVMSAEQFIQER